MTESGTDTDLKVVPGHVVDEGEETVAKHSEERFTSGFYEQEARD